MRRRVCLCRLGGLCRPLFRPAHTKYTTLTLTLTLTLNLNLTLNLTLTQTQTRTSAPNTLDDRRDVLWVRGSQEERNSDEGAAVARLRLAERIKRAREQEECLPCVG